MQTKRLIIVAVGGQGNLLASRVIGEAAMASELPVRMSEIHGMAQRGGVVESALVFGNAESTIISDGNADLLVGFEPLETLRALGRCHRHSTIITNMSPLSPFTVTTGQAQYPDLKTIKKLLQDNVARLIAFDARQLAEKAGTAMAVNMVLVGAVAQTEILPVSKETYRKTIENMVKKGFVDINLKAFELGMEAALKASA